MIKENLTIIEERKIEEKVSKIKLKNKNSNISIEKLKENIKVLYLYSEILEKRNK